MKICPCIDTIYKNADVETALCEISRLGFIGFEFWHAKDYDIERLAELKARFGLEVVNFDAQEVSLADPSVRAEMVRSFEDAVIVAKKLGSGHITVLSGNDTGKSRESQRRSIIDGLCEIAAIAEQTGITVIIEASNRRVNRPNNYLTGADEAFEIIDRVNSKNVKMLYDIYHQQISEGDLLSRIIPNIGKIGHFHAAGVPGRHELDRCEINYNYLLSQISAAGYDQWVGLEYFPLEEPRAGLERLADY